MESTSPGLAISYIVFLYLLLVKERKKKKSYLYNTLIQVISVSFSRRAQLWIRHINWQHKMMIWLINLIYLNPIQIIKTIRELKLSTSLQNHIFALLSFTCQNLLFTFCLFQCRLHCAARPFLYKKFLYIL